MAAERNTTVHGAAPSILEGWLDEAGYCAQRGISRRTAQRERRLRTGPPFVKVGARVY